MTGAIDVEGTGIGRVSVDPPLFPDGALVLLLATTTETLVTSEIAIETEDVTLDPLHEEDHPHDVEVLVHHRLLLGEDHQHLNKREGHLLLGVLHLVHHPPHNRVCSITVSKRVLLELLHLQDRDPDHLFR